MTETRCCLECKKTFQSKSRNQKYCCVECKNQKYVRIAKLRKESGITVSKAEVQRLRQKWLEIKGVNEYEVRD